MKVYKATMDKSLSTGKLNKSFLVGCLVAWPLNESEARRDLVLIQTSLLFLC